MAELRTFHAVESRQSRNERLHGGTVVLASGWGDTPYGVSGREPKGEPAFRHLHTSLIPRSFPNEHGVSATGSAEGFRPGSARNGSFLPRRQRRSVCRRFHPGRPERRDRKRQRMCAERQGVSTFRLWRRPSRLGRGDSRTARCRRTPGMEEFRRDGSPASAPYWRLRISPLCEPLRRA